MFHRRILSSLPLLALVVTACDDSTAPESGALSASEAAALAMALDNSSSNAVQPEPSADGPSYNLLPSAAPRAAISRSDDFDFDLPCPRGGTANFSGESLLELDLEAGYFYLDLTAEQSHDGCGFRTEDGVDITVDGVLGFTAERELREGLARASQSHSGSLDYVTSDGKAGTCLIDLSTDFSFASGTAARTIAGSVCGHEVDLATEWSETE